MSDVIKFSVNNKKYEVSAENGDMRLVDYLHEELNLTGTKFSCGIGACRACTVLVKYEQDAPLETTLSCLAEIENLNDAEIFTVESLGTENNLAPIQKAFLENFSFQCGYCTPGFLIAATGLLERLKNNPVNEHKLDAMIDEWVGSNLCRCTGYVRYTEAIKRIALKTLETLK